MRAVRWTASWTALTCALQAFKVGAITALAITPWGELWVGSSRGSLRVFSLQDVAQGQSHPHSSRLQPSGRELRRTGGAKPHGGAVTNIIIPLGGQVGAC